QHPQFAKLGHERLAELLRLEITIDRRQDALGRERACLQLPLALLFADEGFEVEKFFRGLRRGARCGDAGGLDAHANETTGGLRRTPASPPGYARSNQVASSCSPRLGGAPR